MIRLLVSFALSLLASSAGPARSTTDEIRLRGTVQDVVLLSHFSGKITPVDFDPRFALTVRVESVVPAVKNFPAGAVVAFAIHSPALLFDGDAKKGKTYDFSLHREIERGKTKYFGLLVVKAPISSLKGEAKKKHNSLGWIFSCFAAPLNEQDLF